jgi:hypothetical protein
MFQRNMPFAYNVTIHYQKEKIKIAIFCWFTVFIFQKRTSFYYF